MLATEYILIDISLISYSPSFTNLTELWNIPSAFYLYPATLPGCIDTEYQHSRKPWTLSASLVHGTHVQVPFEDLTQNFRRSVVTAFCLCDTVIAYLFTLRFAGNQVDDLMTSFASQTVSPQRGVMAALDHPDVAVA